MSGNDININVSVVSLSTFNKSVEKISKIIINTFPNNQSFVYHL